jgi:Uri superfamily endonuclease
LNAAALIPARPGTYALLLSAARRQRITVGRLGALPVQPGCYVYLGSARGPGGLRARLRHHVGAQQRPHWHIDYLHHATTPQEIWWSDDAKSSEHLWAAHCGALPGAAVPLARFGASDCDCDCNAHLFYFRTPPDFAAFEQRALPPDGRRRRIFRATDIAAAIPAVVQRRPATSPEGAT